MLHIVKSWYDNMSDTQAIALVAIVIFIFGALITFQNEIPGLVASIF